MTTPSRQQRREEESAENRKTAGRAEKTERLQPLPTATIANGTSEWRSVEEEKQARQQAVEEQLRLSQRCSHPPEAV